MLPPLPHPCSDTLILVGFYLDFNLKVHLLKLLIATLQASSHLTRLRARLPGGLRNDRADALNVGTKRGFRCTAHFQLEKRN
jgi:hypothetical protein